MPRHAPALLLTATLSLMGTALAASTPVKLSALSNAQMIQGALNPAQRQALTEQGFVIVPATHRQFSHVYEQADDASQPAFVTTDAVLHTYHLVFDKTLRDLETQSLAPAVTRLVGLLTLEAQQQVKALKGTPLEADARRTLAYLAVARQLLDPKSTPPAEVSALVKAELNLIAGHKGFAVSPIFRDAASDDVQRLKEDYSQYVPRGHYTRSETLKRYFLGMMWLGHMNLRAANPAETRSAAILAGLVSRNAQAKALWAQVYDPTRLLVGASDDLTFREYAATLQKVTGGDVRQLTNPAKLKAFQVALKAYPGPKVSSMFVRDNEDKDAAQRGLRLMGQRFTLDASAFQQLVYDKVGTQANPRLLPRGLDLMAALGSSAALNILKDLGDTKYANYLPQMQKVQASFKALTPGDWNANVYSGWIYALGALAGPQVRDDRYPAFMQTPAWTRKELLTALGSWTELRHDTILYAKQTYPTFVTSAAPAPVQRPRGYVEPNLTLWNRLLALETLTRTVLTQQKVLSAHTAANLNELHNEISFLNEVSRKQLSGKSLSTDDYNRIQNFGNWLSLMRARSSDPAEPGQPVGADAQQTASIVADVATDPNTGQVREEGTGFIHELYAVVPDGKGGQQVARGGVYSQYEFTVPLSGRLTDEAWRQQLQSGQVPASHAWLKGVLVK